MIYLCPMFYFCLNSNQTQVGMLKFFYDLCPFIKKLLCLVHPQTHIFQTFCWGKSGTFAAFDRRVLVGRLWKQLGRWLPFPSSAS